MSERRGTPLREDWQAARQYRADYVAELESFTRPLFERQRLAIEGAIGFAQGTIRAGFLLNGGALVAVPAAVALFAIDVREVTSGLIWTGALYVFGLLLAWLASMAGYFALYNLGTGLAKEQDQTRAETTRNYYPERPDNIDPKSYNADIKRYQRHGDIWTSAGIALSFLSLLLFVVGTYYGSNIVTTAPIRTEGKPSSAPVREVLPVPSPGPEGPPARS